jgi:hypothetical protein
MTVSDTLLAHVRLATLRLLEQSPGYAANSSVITTSVKEMGLRVPRAFVETEMAWLDEQGLIKLDRVSASTKEILVAVLTERGMDVALGLSTVPGVKRPSPV